VSEESEDIVFRGVVQPFSARQLIVKPEGERAWQWWKVHSETSLSLRGDDIILYRGKNFRVKTDSDYSDYGYYEYDLIEDYT
jgi:hypothetical protein